MDPEDVRDPPSEFRRRSEAAVKTWEEKLRKDKEAYQAKLRIDSERADKKRQEERRRRDERETRSTAEKMKILDARVAANSARQKGPGAEPKKCVTEIEQCIKSAKEKSQLRFRETKA